ncbi:MAG: ABC transporter substrate-binding protein [Acidobacteria bacterium]|nr:ABC transporter substrate-binding protein [Acidobacteriota bacterium]
MAGAKLLPVLIGAGLLLASCQRATGLRVGSKNFTEQLVLGEIIAQHLEHRLGQPVERRLNLGGTLLAHQALQAGEIDLYPEYTGTALTSVLKAPAVSDAAMVLDQVRQFYRAQAQAEWLDPLGFNNSFAMVVRGEDARRLHLATLTEAGAVKDFWQLGVGFEFQTRPDGLPALAKIYHLELKTAPRPMDLGLMFQALMQKSVNMIAANSTDGLLAGADVAILKDDQAAFPPYQAAIVVRQDRLAATPKLREALNELSGKIDDAAMRQMNAEVDVKKRSPREVAAEWLRSAGL